MPDHDHTDHDDFGGLARDLPGIIGRRRALTLLGGAGLAVLVGCSSDSKTSSASASSSSSTPSSSTASTTTSGSSSAASTSAAGSNLAAIPEETAGPFPGDGSNGPDVLTQDGVNRRDIRSSLTSNAVAAGVPLTIVYKLVDAKTGNPLTKAAVYTWHCDQVGRYSMYSSGVTGDTFLRGVQEAASDGTVTFQSIFPGCYSGRWPHIHFEVYPTVAEATKAGTPSATSQIALPEDACDSVYATDGYSASVRNLSQVSLQTDMVFRDSYQQELGTMTGTIADGLTVTLPVAV